MAGFRPQLLINAAQVISSFDRPVLLVWGDACDFFPISDAQRLVADFPHATLVAVPGAKTWVPVDNPAAVSEAISKFAPAPHARGSGRLGDPSATRSRQAKTSGDRPAQATCRGLSVSRLPLGMMSFAIPPGACHDSETRANRVANGVTSRPI